MQTVDVSGTGTIAVNRNVPSFDSALKVGGEHVVLREQTVDTNVTGMLYGGSNAPSFDRAASVVANARCLEIVVIVAQAVDLVTSSRSWWQCTGMQ